MDNVDFSESENKDSPGIAIRGTYRCGHRWVHVHLLPPDVDSIDGNLLSEYRARFKTEICPECKEAKENNV